MFPIAYLGPHIPLRLARLVGVRLHNKVLLARPRVRHERDTVEIVSSGPRNALPELEFLGCGGARGCWAHDSRQGEKHMAGNTTRATNATYGYKGLWSTALL